MGILLRDQGRPAEALLPTEEAVGLLRQLSQDDREVSGLLAASLYALSSILSYLDRPEEASVAMQEADRALKE